jgi:RNA polymerase sigma-70 factor (ECF subfamily)
LDRYGNELFGYARSRLIDSQSAEDVVQETLLAALDPGSPYEGRSDERAWLFGILRHKIVDHVRRSARERSLQGGGDPANGVAGEFTDQGFWLSGPKKWTMDPSEALEDQEFLEVMRCCLSALPEQQSHAFALREIEQLGAGSICEILSVSRTNLSTILHRARSQLRRCLEINWFASRM